MRNKSIVLGAVVFLFFCSCKETFEFTPSELDGKFLANQTSEYASFSCVANPDASFGPSLNIKYVNENQIELYSTTYLWDEKTLKMTEIPTVFKVNMKTHKDHFDLTYKDKVIGDYRVDKIYEGNLAKNKYHKGKILNIRLEDTEEKQFLMFRGYKE